MRKIISVISFIISTILFTYLLIVFIGFVVTLIQNPVLETSEDVMDATIIILIHAGTILITSVLGLHFAIVSAKCFANKIIRICSNIEIVLFSIGIIFSLFQLFIK